jgi:hypothetical protein
MAFAPTSIAHLDVTAAALTSRALDIDSTSGDIDLPRRAAAAEEAIRRLGRPLDDEDRDCCAAGERCCPVN